MKAKRRKGWKRNGKNLSERDKLFLSISIVLTVILLTNINYDDYNHIDGPGSVLTPQISNLSQGISFFTLAEKFSGTLTGAMIGLENLETEDLGEETVEEFTIEKLEVGEEVVVEELKEPIIEDVSIEDLAISVEADATTCGDVNANLTLTANVNATGTCLTINTSNIIVDCANYKITYGLAGNDNNYGVNIGANANVTVINCSIVDGNTTGEDRHAIYSIFASNATVINNTINTSTSGSIGVYLSFTPDSNVSNNTIESRGHGMFIESSENSEVNYNSINSSGHGIYLSSSDNVTIKNNSVVTYGNLLNAILIQGSSFSNLSGNSFNTSDGVSIRVSTSGLIIRDNFNQTITEDNLVEGGPVIYNFSIESQIVYQDKDLSMYGQVICAWCSNVTYDNVTLSNDSINFFNTSSSTIKNCKINSDVGYGIWESGNSKENDYQNNTINTTGNFQDGIYLNSGGSINSLINNTISTSGNYSEGIYVGSTSTTINNNTINTSGWYAEGIYIASETNLIEQNIITADNSTGVEINTGTNNNLSRNTIRTVKSYAVFFNDSGFNQVTNGVLRATNFADVGSDDTKNNNTLINVSFDRNVTTINTGTVEVAWYVNVYVNDTDGNAITNAIVNTVDQAGSNLGSLNTTGTGFISTFFQVIEFYQNSSGTTYHIPHNFSATKYAYRPTSIQTINLSQMNGTRLTFTLEAIPYNFTLSQPANQSVDNNTNATYYILLTNTGLNTDNYTVTVINSSGATVAETNMSTISEITSSNDYNFSLTVGNATAGNFLVKVNVSSEGNNSIVRNVSVTTTITAVAGNLSATQVEPTKNVSRKQNKTFIYSTEISCVGGDCGNITATLDPPAASWGSTSPVDCGNNCSSCKEDGNGTIDACSDGALCDLLPAEISNISITDLSGNTFTGGDTISANITALCFAGTDTIIIAYNNGTGWQVKYNQTCSAGGTEFHNTSFALDNVGREHSIRGVLTVFGSGCVCGSDCDANFADSDDLNITVIASGGSKSGAIANGTSGTPFYTTSSNPRNKSIDLCLENMSAGDSCQLNWTVNATGVNNVSHLFFVIFESDLTGVNPINSSSINLTIFNNHPNITALTISPSTVYTNTDLTTNVIFSDIDNDSGTVYFRWYIDNVNIYNQTNASVLNGTLVKANLDSDNLSLNNKVNVSAYANDSSANSETLWSNTITVQAIPSSSSSSGGGTASSSGGGAGVPVVEEEEEEEEVEEEEKEEKKEESGGGGEREEVEKEAQIGGKNIISKKGKEEKKLKTTLSLATGLALFQDVVVLLKDYSYYWLVFVSLALFSLMGIYVGSHYVKKKKGKALLIKVREPAIEPALQYDQLLKEGQLEEDYSNGIQGKYTLWRGKEKVMMGKEFDQLGHKITQMRKEKLFANRKRVVREKHYDQSARERILEKEVRQIDNVLQGYKKSRPQILEEPQNRVLFEQEQTNVEQELSHLDRVLPRSVKMKSTVLETEVAAAENEKILQKEATKLKKLLQASVKSPVVLLRNIYKRTRRKNKRLREEEREAMREVKNISRKIEGGQVTTPNELLEIEKKLANLERYHPKDVKMRVSVPISEGTARSVNKKIVAKEFKKISKTLQRGSKEPSTFINKLIKRKRRKNKKLREEEREAMREVKKISQKIQSGQVTTPNELLDVKGKITKLKKALERERKKEVINK